MWLDYFAVLGIGEQAVADLRLFYVVSWFEIALGLAVLFKPARGLLVFVCTYKVGTELLRPMAGEPWWEFIERAGSYVAPVALIVVDRWRAATATLDDESLSATRAREDGRAIRNHTLDQPRPHATPRSLTDCAVRG